MAVKKKQVTLIATDAKIDDMIKSIANRGTKLQGDMHRVLASLAVRWHETGDVTVAVRQVNALLDAVPSAMRANAIKSWTEAFLGFVWSTEDKCFVYHKNRTKITKTDARACIDTPFWDFAPEPEYKPMNLSDMISALVARAEKRRQDGLQDSDDVPQDMLKALKSIVS